MEDRLMGTNRNRLNQDKRHWDTSLDDETTNPEITPVACPDVGCYDLDVVMTATLRPELIDLTLVSFFRNLFRQLNGIRLIINIDPIGDRHCTAADILKICGRYADEVVHRCPQEPS